MQIWQFIEVLSMTSPKGRLSVLCWIRQHIPGEFFVIWKFVDQTFPQGIFIRKRRSVLLYLSPSKNVLLLIFFIQYWCISSFSRDHCSWNCSINSTLWRTYWSCNLKISSKFVRKNSWYVCHSCLVVYNVFEWRQKKGQEILGNCSLVTR